ncbi:hypothetical protein D3C72_2114420 [compost metagenome]
MLRIDDVACREGDGVFGLQIGDVAGHVVELAGEVPMRLDRIDQHPHALGAWRLRVVAVEGEDQLDHLAGAHLGDGLGR